MCKEEKENMEGKLDRFLRYLEAERGFSPTTIEAYRLDLEKGLFPFLHQRGKFDVTQVTRDDIRAFLDFLTFDRGNSNAARKRKLAATKSLFNYLVETDGLKVSPAASIKSPQVPEKEPIYLTDEECICLLETVLQKAMPQVRERDMAIVVLFLHTGLRVSELVGLKLANVNLERRQIKITRKGNKEQYLHLNSESVKVLAEYLVNRPQAWDGRFFVDTSGQNLNRVDVYVTVRRYLEMAGIDKGKKDPHLLRHTFCTRLHQKGVGPFVIKDLAGHKSLSTTMRYVRIESKERSEAVDRLEFGAFGGDSVCPEFNRYITKGSGDSNFNRQAQRF